MTIITVLISKKYLFYYKKIYLFHYKKYIFILLYTEKININFII